MLAMLRLYLAIIPLDDDDDLFFDDLSTLAGMLTSRQVFRYLFWFLEIRSLDV